MTSDPFGYDEDADAAEVEGAGASTMDLDTLFLGAVLREGMGAWADARSRGFTTELLEGPAKLIGAFVQDYVTQYKALPDLEVVSARFGVEFPSVSGPADFFTQQVLERSLAHELQKVMADTTAILAKGEVAKAYETFRTGSRGLIVFGQQDAVVPLGVAASQAMDRYDLVKSGVRGLQTPWPTLNDCTLGMWPENLWVFVARQGVGKCVEGSTEIVDPVSGVPRTIQQLYKTQDQQRVMSWSKARGVHGADVFAAVDTGTKECLRFRLASGRSIVVTPEHPFLTPEGWARADAVRVGGSLGLPASMPFPENPVDLPRAEVDFLAALLSEGGCSGTSLRVSTADPLWLAVVVRAVEELGGSVVKVGDRYDYNLRSHVPKGGAGGILRIAEKHGVRGKLAKHKTIPEAIYRLPRESLARFFSVFWMADGYVCEGSPGITLASERMVRQLQHLLLRFGVQSSVAHKVARCNGKTFDAWRLRVYASSIAAFHAAIPLWGAKAERLQACATRARNPNVGYPRVQPETRAKIEALAKTLSGRWKGGGLSEVGARLGHTSWFMTRSLFGVGNSLRLPAFKVFCEVYGCVEEYRWLWDSGLFWDTIVSIESAGPQRIYDLQVPATSCFVANDVVVHNTTVVNLLSLHAWSAGKRVLFVTTEMSQVENSQRLLSMHLKLDANQVRGGCLDAEKEDTLRDYVAKLKDLDRDVGFYFTGGNFTANPASIEAACTELEPDLLIADAPYLFKMGGKDRLDNTARAFNFLKGIARGSNMACVSNMQFNRDGAKEVAIENVGLTDAAGWNADYMGACHATPDDLRDRVLNITGLKLRNGQLHAPFRIRWDWRNMDFTEILASEEEESYDPGVESVPEEVF